MKIVINKCFGGFGLTDKAIEMYLNLATTDPDSKLFGAQIAKSKDSSDRVKWTLIYGLEAKSFYYCNISRTDPILIQVVEKLGNEVNDSYSNLQIEDIPSGTMYRINEYDGNEFIEYKENDSWLIAT